MEMIYDQEFYSKLGGDKQKEYSFRNYYIPELQNIAEIKSAIDIGCGTGMLLHELEKLGIQDVIGIDRYCGEELLQIPSRKFYSYNLEEISEGIENIWNEIGNKRFDIACCLEVVEHLSTYCANNIVKLLTMCSDLILFSAAIPYQGGDGHINEQWPSYWEEKFNKMGYVRIDWFRRKFWDKFDCIGYYRQNIVLYVKADCINRYPLLETFRSEGNDLMPMHVVHPTVYNYSVRNSLKEFSKDKYPATALEQQHIEKVKVLCNREEMLKRLPKNRVCVEIGVAIGGFSKKILEICKPQKLYCIDIWNDDKTYQKALEELKDGIDSNIVEIMKGDSVELLRALQDESVDFIYIDANHDYIHPKKELELCDKKIKKDGYIGGHDYVMANVHETPMIQYGVINAVNKFVVNNNYEFVYLTLENLYTSPSFCLKKRMGK